MEHRLATPPEPSFEIDNEDEDKDEDDEEGISKSCIHLCGG